MKKIIALAVLVSFQAIASEKCLRTSNNYFKESVESLLSQSDEVIDEIEFENDGFADESIVELNSALNQNDQRSCLDRYNQHLMLGKKRTKLLRVSLVAGVAILAAAPMLTGAGVAFAAVGAGAAVSGGAGAVPMMVGAGFTFGGVTTAGAIGSLWEPKTLSGLEKGILAAQWASSDNSTSAPRFLRRMINEEQSIILTNIKNDIQLRYPNESRKVVEAMFMNKVVEQSNEISIASIQRVKEFINEKLSNEDLCPEGKLPLNLRKIEKLHKRHILNL
jgi:hypothetical protein